MIIMLKSTPISKNKMTWNNRNIQKKVPAQRIQHVAARNGRRRRITGGGTTGRRGKPQGKKTPESNNALTN